jgi:hypothetical protein
MFLHDLLLPLSVERGSRRYYFDIQVHRQERNRSLYQQSGRNSRTDLDTFEQQEKQ